MDAETSSGTFDIRSEERGPHWIAWVASDPGGKPAGAVVLVGETREEAESRARQYAERLAAPPDRRSRAVQSPGG